jgi:predicted metal-dependent hydrolase
VVGGRADHLSPITYHLSPITLLLETRRLLSRGRALFDRGAYFEAHEVWEAAWLGERGDTRRLLQGLIQIAAAFYKLSRGDAPGGALKLLDAALARLDGVEDRVAARLPLSRFRDATARTRERVAMWARGDSARPDSKGFPRLRAGHRPPGAAKRKLRARRASTRRKSRAGS